MGTRNRMSVARCCCQDECGCNRGTNPDTWTVVLSGVANKNCDNCGDYNGTYTLTRRAGSDCTWEYTFPSCSCCCPYSEFHDQLTLSVVKLPSGQLRVAVSIRVVTAEWPCQGYTCSYVWSYVGQQYVLVNSCPSPCNCPSPPTTFQGPTWAAQCDGGPCNDLNNGLVAGNTCAFWRDFATHDCAAFADTALDTIDNDCYNACDFADATCLVTANGPYQ